MKKGVVNIPWLEGTHRKHRKVHIQEKKGHAPDTERTEEKESKEGTKEKSHQEAGPRGGRERTLAKET